MVCLAPQVVHLSTLPSPLCPASTSLPVRRRPKILLSEGEGKVFRKSSPRGRRVDLEERQEVTIGRLLDQMRLGRGGKPADLAESAR